MVICRIQKARTILEYTINNNGCLQCTKFCNIFHKDKLIIWKSVNAPDWLSGHNFDETNHSETKIHAKCLNYHLNLSEVNNSRTINACYVYIE